MGIYKFKKSGKAVSKQQNILDILVKALRRPAKDVESAQLANVVLPAKELPKLDGTTYASVKKFVEQFRDYLESGGRIHPKQRVPDHMRTVVALIWKNHCTNTGMDFEQSEQLSYNEWLTAFEEGVARRDKISKVNSSNEKLRFGLDGFPLWDDFLSRSLNTFSKSSLKEEDRIKILLNEFHGWNSKTVDRWRAQLLSVKSEDSKKYTAETAVDMIHHDLTFMEKLKLEGWKLDLKPSSIEKPKVDDKGTHQKAFGGPSKGRFVKMKMDFKDSKKSSPEDMRARLLLNLLRKYRSVDKKVMEDRVAKNLCFACGSHEHKENECPKKATLKRLAGTIQAVSEVDWIPAQISNNGACLDIFLCLDSQAKPMSYIRESIGLQLLAGGAKGKDIELAVQMGNGEVVSCHQSISLLVSLGLQDDKKEFELEAVLLPNLDVDLVVGAADIIKHGLSEELLEGMRKVLANSLKVNGENDVELPQMFLYVDEDGEEQAVEKDVQEVLSAFQDVFDIRVKPQPAKVPLFDIELKPGCSLQGLRQRARTFSAVEEKAIEEQVKELLGLGIISEADSSVYSEVVLARKKDGSYRMCIDFRELNKITEDVSYPLPRIGDMVHKLGGQFMFSTLDLVSGYHQVGLTERARELTAFRTPFGVFKFNRLPFGLKNAPSFFQRIMMTEVLNGLVNNICHTYIDDIVVVGTSRQTHLDNLVMVLQRLRDKGLVVKKSKCTFTKLEIQYLGHVICQSGHTFDKKRVEAVMKLQLPETITELRSLLGTANFFRTHIKQFAEIVAPLEALLVKGKNKKVAWNGEARQAFEEIKRKIAESPMLAFVRDEGQLILFTDASQKAVGGHLTQLDTSGELHTLGFFSRKLTGSQLNWSTPDAEMYAIYSSIQAFRHLLAGRKFIIRCDHKNLRFAMAKSPRVERWKLALMEFNFDIEYIKGPENVVADCFSRLVISDNGTLKRMVGISLEQKQQLMREFHEGMELHPPAAVTIKRLKDAGHTWEGLETDVKTFVSSCLLCQERRDKFLRYSGTNFNSSSTYPLEQIAIDTIGPIECLQISDSKKYILTIIDQFSRWVELVALDSVSAEECAHKLLEFFCRYGTPKSILSDQGTQFKNQVIHKLVELTNGNQVFTAVAQHQANGICERANGEVRRLLGFWDGEHTCLQDILAIVARVMNSRRHSTLGLSPADIMYGMAHRLDYKLFHNLERQSEPSNLHTFYETIVNNQHDFWAEATEGIVNQQKKKGSDLKKTHQDIQTGNWVLLDVDGKVKRGAVKRNGPYEVIAIDGNLVKLKSSRFPGRSKQVHISRVHHFRERKGVNPLSASLRKTDLYVVEEILAHKAGKSLATSKVLVRWEGFDEPTWEPLSNKSIRALVAFRKYAEGKAALEKYIL
jgi:hypothetical protein